jgi:hypothetical protein
MSRKPMPCMLSNSSSSIRVAGSGPRAIPRRNSVSPHRTPPFRGGVQHRNHGRRRSRRPALPVGHRHGHPGRKRARSNAGTSTATSETMTKERGGSARRKRPPSAQTNRSRIMYVSIGDCRECHGQANWDCRPRREIRDDVPGKCLLAEVPPAGPGGVGEGQRVLGCRHERLAGRCECFL